MSPLKRTPAARAKRAPIVILFMIPPWVLVLLQSKAQYGCERVVLRVAQVAVVLEHGFDVRADEETEVCIEGSDRGDGRVGDAEVLVASRHLERRPDDVVRLGEPGVEGTGLFAEQVQSLVV